MRIMPIAPYHSYIKPLDKKPLVFKGNNNTDTETAPENRGLMNAITDIFKTKVKSRKESVMQSSIRFFAKESSVLSEEIKSKGLKTIRKTEEKYENYERTIEYGTGIAHIYEARAKYFTLEMNKALEAQSADMTEERKEAFKNEERSAAFEEDTIVFFKDGKIKKIAEELPNGHFTLIDFDKNGNIKAYYKDATRLDDAGFEAPEAYIYENGNLKTAYKEVLKTFTGEHRAKESIDVDEDEITVRKNIVYGANGIKTGEIIVYKNEKPSKYIKNQKETRESTEAETIYTFKNNKLTEYLKGYKRTKDGKTTQDAAYRFNTKDGRIEYHSRENTDKGKKTTLRKLWFEEGRPTKYQENDGPVFVLGDAKWQIV